MSMGDLVLNVASFSPAFPCMFWVSGLGSLFLSLSLAIGPLQGSLRFREIHFPKHFLNYQGQFSGCLHLFYCEGWKPEWEGKKLGAGLVCSTGGSVLKALFWYAPPSGRVRWQFSVSVVIHELRREGRFSFSQSSIQWLCARLRI